MIQMTKEQLDRAQPEQLLEEIRPILDHRLELYRRYRRKNGSTEMMHGGSENGTEKAIIAFEYYITKMVDGYLGGKAPMYSVRQGERPEGYAQRYKAAIDSIRHYNDDAATFIELIHDYLITTSAHLYLMEDPQNEIRYVRFDSRQTVSVFDYATPPNQIGVVRTWTQEHGRTEFVEVITSAEKRTYQGSGSGFVLLETEPLSWGEAPCVSFEEPDGIAVFEPALSPINTYEQLVNNIRNMSQYNDNAKLMIRGYSPRYELGTPERQKEDREWIEAVTIFVGDGGDISWLLKQVDYSGALSVEKSLHDSVTMLTGVPNMTDEAFSNADNASALGYKLYPLDQYSATTDRVFRKGYLRLWELITERLNLRGANFDFRDIDILMQRNIPTDRDKSIARAVQMKGSGLFSDETCINESSVEVDANEEIARRTAEEEQDFLQVQERNAASFPKEGEDTKWMS